jgi:hypothetical protein
MMYRVCAAALAFARGLVMMRAMKLLKTYLTFGAIRAGLAAVGIVLAAACGPLSVHPPAADAAGEYQDQQLSAGEYWLRFANRESKGSEQLEYYWRRRARELCGSGRYTVKFEPEHKPMRVDQPTIPHLQGIAKCTAAPTGREYHNVAVEISPGTGLRDFKGLEMLKKDFIKELSIRLEDSGYPIGISAANEADLQLRIVVHHLTYTSTFARSSMGMLAGHAVLDAAAVLVDAASGTALWQADLKKQSDPQSGAAADSTPRQVEALSFRIAAGIESQL